MKQGRKISIVSRMFAVLLAVMMVCSNISLPSKAAETVQTIAAWEYKDKDSAPSSLPAGATSGSGQLKCHRSNLYRIFVKKPGGE